ncbi:hypothetical protein HPB47_013110 [Ixodes persulcatus]|uniref:Uncharacterized protein n=1 Tax=Ixodes persulcatus TaxID=34615 RepID=A0AC60NRP9_IXOPE|nr:hypothetical protein HPB47_013110 [Ixodes persulcatus]
MGAKTPTFLLNELKKINNAPTLPELLTRIWADSGVIPAVLAFWGRAPGDASPACPHYSIGASRVGLRNLFWCRPNIRISKARLP